MSKNAAIKTPQDRQLHGLTTAELVELWQSARSRAFVAEHEPAGQPDTDDYWTELAVATRLSDEVTAGRWCVVRRLLSNGAVTDWTQVGQAAGLTATEVRAGFIDWITQQVFLRQQTGTIGTTDAEADELYELVRSVER